MKFKASASVTLHDSGFSASESSVLCLGCWQQGLRAIIDSKGLKGPRQSAAAVEMEQNDLEIHKSTFQLAMQGAKRGF